MKWSQVLLLNIIFLVVVLPVSAQTITYNCADGMAIYTLTMVGNSPTTATFELYRQDGSTTSGSWSYQPYYVLGYPLATTASITLEGDSKSLVFVTPGQIHISLYPSRNLTEIAETRLIMGAGQSGAINNIAVEQTGVTSAIIGFKIIADNDITYSKTEDKLETINANLQSPGVGEIMELAYSTFWNAFNFVKDLIFAIKFFFVDNWMMIFALFLAVPMAFAAKNSKGNPERFLRQYFKSLRGFIDFVMNMWRMLIESIGTIRGWFRV